MSYNPKQPREPKGSSDGGQWVTYYHGTFKENIASILKVGLQPGKYQDKAVYLSQDVKWATDWAQFVSKEGNTSTGQKGRPAVVEVRLPANYPGLKQIAGGQATLPSTIPSKYLREMSFGAKRKGPSLKSFAPKAMRRSGPGSRLLAAYVRLNKVPRT